MHDSLPALACQMPPGLYPKCRRAQGRCQGLLRRTLSDQASFLQRNKPVSRPYGLLQIMKCHDDSVAIFPVQVFQ